MVKEKFRLDNLLSITSVFIMKRVGLMARAYWPVNLVAAPLSQHYSPTYDPKLSLSIIVE